AVSFGKTSTVYFKNTYEGVAKLVIKKTVTGISGNLSDGQKKAIRFTVTNDKGTPVASFSLDNMSLGRDGVYSYTIENLVPGQYKVEETVDDELFKDYTRKTTYKVEVAAAAEGTKAAFQAKHGSTTVTFTNAYTEIAPLEVIKTGSKSYVGFVTIDGLKYPVWRFTLEISNLNPLTTKNGTTTFTDMFDAQKADWFRLATEEEVKAMAPQDTTYGANAYVLLSKDGKPAPTAAFNADCSITITGITAETAEKCEYTYYLIVKDADALEELNKPQTPGSAEVKHSFTNVVTYHPLPHKTDTKKTEYGYEYKFVALDKQLTNLGDDGQLYKEYNGKKIVVDRAAYSVTLNPQGISIGDEATITAVDTFSENQIVLLSSIKVTPGAGVTYKLDNASHTLTFTIPNGTPVTISYEATIVGSGIVTLRNDIELKGFTKSTGGDAKQEMGGSGEGTIYSVKLIKTDVNDNSKRLEGAEFGLYDGVTGNLLTTVTTNELGEVTIKEWKDNDKSFRVDHNYYLAELTAPDGYYLPQKGTEIWFRFSSDPTKVGTTVTEGGYPILLLVNGGEIIVNNTPITVNLEVTKSFDRWDLQNSFSFVLEADADEPLPADGNTKVTVTKEDPTAAFGQIHLAEGFGTYRYIIREVVDPADVVPGIVYDLSEHYVTVTVADNDDDGIAEVYVAYENSDDLVIVNRYETVDIEGTKVWNDDADRDGIRPESITIRLYADGEEIDSVEVTEQDDWSFSFTDLIRYSDNGVTPIVYTISEDEVEGYTTLITGNAAAGFTVTNTHDIDTIEVKGIKVWDDANNGNLTRPESISINLLADGVKVASITVTQADNWTFSFTDLPRCSADGKAIVYTITEDAVENYTTVITGNAADGFVVTNTNIPELPHTPGDPPLPPTGPNTGDNSNAGLWMALMMLASLAAGAAFVARKKREA
ncbi:MAG: Cna B-type domain-containing protein, partial [Lachnospiraceae bacterium]|nr:Cna B-type domain-containing protein [Lachnospiraceae bacterium]